MSEDLGFLFESMGRIQMELHELRAVAEAATGMADSLKRIADFLDSYKGILEQNGLILR